MFLTQFSRRTIGLAATLCLPLVIATVVHADDASIGGDARTFGMGGAGLALPYGGGQRINPASLAFERKPFGLAAPSVGIQTDGLSKTNIQNAVKDGSAGAAGDLLREYGSSDKNIGLTSDISLRISKFEISSYGAVRGHLQPNAALASWATNGNGNVNTLPFNSRADLIAGGYYTLPAVSAGTTLPMSAESAYNYGVGIRLKEIKGVYSHYIADAGVINGTIDSALHAPEMHGADVLSKNGVGADVGFYMQPRGGQGVGYAVTINNLVNPNISFAGTDRNGNAANYKLLGTTVNAGLGYQNHATAFAADLVDLGGTTEKKELRIGMEQRVLTAFALRGGYASNTGYTYGFGIFGFGVAGGKHLPLEVSQSLKF